MYKLNLYEIPNFLQKQSRHTLVQLKRNRVSVVRQWKRAQSLGFDAGGGDRVAGISTVPHYNITILYGEIKRTSHLIKDSGPVMLIDVKMQSCMYFIINLY